MSCLITWHGVTGDVLGCSMSIIQRRHEETAKTDKFEIVIRVVMQRIEATMRNLLPWLKSRYICSEDAGEVNNSTK
jgi:hypothetical protein